MHALALFILAAITVVIGLYLISSMLPTANIPKKNDVTIEGQTIVIDEIKNKTSNLMEKISKFIKESHDAFHDNTDKALDDLIQIIKTFIDNAGGYIDKVREIIINTIAEISGLMKLIIDSIKTIISSTITWLRENGSTIIKNIKMFMLSIKDLFNSLNIDNLSSMIKNIKDSFATIMQLIKQIIMTIIDQVKVLYTSITSIKLTDDKGMIDIKDNSAELNKNMDTMLSTINIVYDGFSSTISKGVEITNNTISSIVDSFVKINEDTEKYVFQVVDASPDVEKISLQGVLSVLEIKYNEIDEFLRTFTIPDVSDAANKLFQLEKENRELVNNFSDKINNFANSIKLENISSIPKIIIYEGVGEMFPKNLVLAFFVAAVLGGISIGGILTQ